VKWRPESQAVAATDRFAGFGARMSYLRFVDQPDGVDVFFDDVVNPSFGAESDFRETSVATLDRTSAHTIRFSIDFVAGPATTWPRSTSTAR